MSGCACMVEADFDKPSFAADGIRKAASCVTCGECGGTIFRGEEHERCVGKWDGEWSIYRTCKVCLEARDHFCCTWYYEHVWESIHEAICAQDGDLALCCLDGLSPPLALKVQGLLDEIWSDMDEDENEEVCPCE